MFEKNTKPENILFTFLVIVIGIIVLILLRQKSLPAPRIAKPTPHSAALYIGDGGEQPWIQVNACNQKVKAVLDTGSSKAVLNVEPCVKTSAPSNVVYAQGAVQVRAAREPVQVTLGDTYLLQTSLVDFTRSFESVLGINNHSALRNRSFSVRVSRGGRAGGWFTIDDDDSSSGSVSGSGSISGGNLVDFQLPLRNFFAFLAVPVQVVPHDTRKPQQMLAIIDTGSTNMFVDGQLLRAATGFEVYAANDATLSRKIDSFSADLVLKNEGGAQFTQQLQQHRAFILGFPFCWGKDLNFDKKRGKLLINLLNF